MYIYIYKYLPALDRLWKLIERRRRRFRARVKLRGRETAADPERLIKDAARVKPVARAYTRSNLFLSFFFFPDSSSKGLIIDGNESERATCCNMRYKLRPWDISNLNSPLERRESPWKGKGEGKNYFYGSIVRTSTRVKNSVLKNSRQL